MNVGLKFENVSEVSTRLLVQFSEYEPPHRLTACATPKLYVVVALFT